MFYFKMDPVLFSVGPISIRWYGLMYLLGFALAFYDCYQRRYRDPQKAWTVDDLLDLFFYAALGVIFGGELGLSITVSTRILYQRSPPSLTLLGARPLLSWWAVGCNFKSCSFLSKASAFFLGGLRFYSPRRTTGYCYGSPRQFYQWGIMGTCNHDALGITLCGCGRSTTTSFGAL